jgi:hypothetical protein
MAFITKVSGGSQPVFATDVLNGPIAQSANIAAQGPTNFQGPKLDYFSVTANATVATQGGVNGYVANVIQAVQQTATVAIFQVGSNPAVMNFAVYPTGAFANTATFVAAVQTANAAIGVPTANVAGSATFTNLADVAT